MDWGMRALVATLASILFALLGLAWYAPEALPFVPIALVGLCAVAVLSRYPFANLGVVLASFVFAVNSDVGLQVSEVLYGLYLYAYIVLWYVRRLLRGERILFNATDRAALLFIVGGTLLGTAMALVFGASLSDLRSDLTAFLVLALYFPVKEACRCAPRGPDLIVYAMIGLGIFLGIQNIVVFRSIISSATLAWQVADARFAATEALIMIGSSGVLFLLLDANRWHHRLGLLALLLFMLASLILTKGRTFWMAFAFGTVLSLLFLGGRQRFRLIFLTTVGSAVLVLITVTFFGQLADLVFSGTLKRLATLQGASSQDHSLIARFVEWNALWDFIVRNPILGHGFGTTYRFYDIIDVGTVDRTFTHNGYLGAWFKLGIFGLLVLLFLWVRGIWDAIVVYRAGTLSERHRTYALLSIVSLAALALAANASIFFIYMNQLFPFALLTGMASGLRQRNLALVGRDRVASTLPARAPDGSSL